MSFINDRSLYIIGPINKESLDKFVGQFHVLLSRNQTESITVYITSGGGSARFGLALFEIIRIAPVPVYTVAVGGVDSAALLPFVAGQKRFTTKQTFFTFHPNSFSSEDMITVDELQQIARDTKRYFELYSEIIAERTNEKMNKNDVINLQKDFITLTAHEALEKGITHEIINYTN